MKRLTHILTAAFLLVSLAATAQTQTTVTVGGNVYAGGKSAAVTGDTKVTVNQSGAVLSGDVYGGGALADVGTNNSNTTTVDILDGTITGNVYGGGLGRKGSSKDTPVAALVNGKVYVNIGQQRVNPTTLAVIDTIGNATLGGNVFGCNNANGSPKDDVFVHVWKTNQPAGTTFDETGYAINQVFGGGNEADYSITNHKAQVYIHGCNNTIRRVFGGGNAAAAWGVQTTIDGGRFNYVFGGGNGEASEANIGGGGATLTIKGGKVGQFFGGSNEQGEITGPLTVNIEDGDCGLDIENFYCGSNMVPIVGDVKTTIHCNDNFSVTNLYGGSNKADITGNVELTIEGGTFTNVFGGSKGVDGGTPANIKDNTTTTDVCEGNVTLNLYGGTITNAYGGSDQNGNIEGKITVNVLDYEGSCALNVTNIYGAGNLTAYTPNTSGITSPEVNVMHVKSTMSITGNVYGGAKGDDTHPATVSANPKVNIGYDATSMSTLVPEGHTMPSPTYAKIDGIVFGGGDFSPVAGNTTVTIQTANSSAASLFGGGNQASVGNATVNVLGGNVSTGVYGGCNTSGTVGGTINSVAYDGTIAVNIKSNLGTSESPLTEGIYGGGKGGYASSTEQGTFTTGTVTVTIGDGTTPSIYSDVYGGSAFGQVSASGKLTKVDLKGGIINGTIYGGGKGSDTYTAEVSGNTELVINGSVTKGVYGGCNVKGNVLGNSTVGVTGGNIGHNTESSNVYGAVYGGGLGENTKVLGNVAVTVNGADINGDVYGGSAQGLVNCNQAGNAQNNNAYTQVTLTSGAITGDLYGGGHGLSGKLANVWGPVTVNVNGGSVNNVFGCNNAAGAPQSTVAVNVTNNTGTISKVFGGGNEAHYGSTPVVTVSGGSIANVYGGGNNISGTNKGVKGGNVTISGGSVTTGVYGGCNTQGTVDGNIIVLVEGGQVGAAGATADIYGGGYGGDSNPDDTNPEGTYTTGNVTVTLTGTTVYGDIYGGSAFGSVNGASTNLTTVNIQGSNLHGQVFGGGKGQDTGTQYTATTNGAVAVNIEAANDNLTGVYGGANVKGNVAGNINVNVKANVGKDANNTCDIYGGGLGSNTTTAGTVTVTVDQASNPTIYGDIYGGSAFGQVSASGKLTKVDFQKGTLNGTIYGGGKGQLAATAPVVLPAYSAVVNGNVEVAVGDGSVSKGVYGGCNEKGNVKGDITMNITKGTIGVNDANTKDGVFGGGLGAATTTEGDVTVNIATNTATAGPTIYGDLYGGSGFGQVSASGKFTRVNFYKGTINGDVYGGGLGDPSNAATVSGNVEVNIRGGVFNKADGTLGGGRVFGCNNAKGTPNGTVAVNIYGTDHGTGVANNECPAVGTITTAAQLTQNALNQTYAIAGVYGGGNLASYEPGTGQSATVHIYDCNNTIKDVFGGGNAANVGTTSVSTNTFVIVDGGRIDRVFGGGNGDPTDANIYGTASTTINAGLIGQIYGGNNLKGSITNTNLNLAKIGSCSDEVFGEVFGGANEAPITGSLSTTIACGVGTIGTMYGGSNKAKIGTEEQPNAEVNLTINGGNYDYVFGGSKGEEGNGANIYGAVNLNLNGGAITNAFGGSNVEGNITGKITVNVEDQGSCDLELTNVYGGGKDASYKPTDHSQEWPEVNIKHIKQGHSVANVYGGGYGSEAEVKSYPKVTIGDSNSSHYVAVSNNVYGGGEQAPVTGNTKVILQNNHSSVAKNVYGGGNLADVSGSTTVMINGGTVSEDVYGGGALANVGGSSVTLDGGTARLLFGGGMGNASNAALVNNNTAVTVSSGTVNGLKINETGSTDVKGAVFGGCNVNGTVKGGATVTISGAVGTGSNRVNVYGGGLGEKTNVQGNVAVAVGANVFGDVYGGSAKGLVNYTYNNNATPTTPSSDTTGVTINSGTVSGDIYGGGHGLDGKSANVGGAVTVLVKGGTVNNVYGANNVLGSPQSTVKVDVENGTVNTNVFGGGNLAAYSAGSPEVNIKGGIVKQSVFGGGNEAGVGSTSTTTTVNVTGGTVGQSSTTANPYGIYGGCNTSGEVTGAIAVNIKGGTLGTNSNKLKGIFGGGYGSSTTTTGNVTVTIGDMEGNKVPTVYGDIYGGSALGKVNTNTDNLTKVDFLNGTLHGNIYGGGLGDADHDTYGQVNGKINVNIGASGQDVDQCHITLTGSSIYGCNNTNGTPKGDVTVNVYKTAHTTVNSVTGSTYAIDKVFGGGRNASFTEQGKKATVNIYDCYNTIGWVFGGGDAADVPGAVVMIEGGHFDWVFGGGNGAGTGNPGANIGAGGASLTVHGGLIGHLFGGSNEKGNITGPTTVNIDNTGSCGEEIAEFFGGSNMVDITGNIETTIGCGTKFGTVYGGSNKAKITGNVILNITGGTFNNIFGGSKGDLSSLGQDHNNVEANICDYPDGHQLQGTGGNVTLNLFGGTVTEKNSEGGYVFGGSNYNGKIDGKITVNVLDTTDCQAFTAVNLYGAGNLTAYTPKNSSIISPEVNIIHIKDTTSITGNVYGGGLGASATVTANPKVTIGYDAATMGTLVTNLIGSSYSSDTLYAKIDGNVYGGGEEAAVVGGTTVKVQHANTIIGNDVYGGGALANVGSSSVTLDGGTVRTLYGGGMGNSTKAALVNNNAQVTVNSGTINGTVIDNTTNLKGGVFGGCNVKGTVKGSSTVLINGAVGSDGNKRNIYGGGLGENTNVVGDVAVKIGANVFGDVYGGSAKGLVNYTYNNDATPTTPSSDTTGVTLNSGTVSGDIYGGGHGLDGKLANVGGAVTVLVNGGSVDNVYGCNNAAGAPKSTVKVDIKNGTVNTNVYGGGNLAAYTDTPDVNILNGTVSGSVFGGGNEAGVGGGDVTMTNGQVLTGLYGGCNNSGTVSGPVNVYVNGGTVGTSASNPAYGVFGGGKGNQTRTDDDVTVTIGNETTTPTIYGNVYGGSAEGNVSASGKLTKVWLKKGAVTGDIYGGGFGDNDANALVNGNVQVVVDGGTVSAIDANNGGRVFGCNNLNGTPKGSVVVTINNTEASSGSGSTKVYALQGVYGGGNLAHYDPTTAANGYPQVTIGCNTSIKDVFGGGNAAAVPQTSLIINGGDIKRVFAGGNGTSGAAHVGYKNKVTGSTSNEYGNGNTSAVIKGGTIEQVFGGSNANGMIHTIGALTVNKDGDCAMKIGEVYGGGNEADGAAAELSIGCTGALVDGANGHIAHPENIGTTLEGIGKVFGGANQADVTSNIMLNINKGIVRQVFGGNNTSGEISGTIQVNINKNSDACGWYVGDVFGGGDHAWYGGKPDVNIQNGTVYGNVYGGGNDITTDGKGVNESDVEVSGGIVMGGVYGGCNENGTVVTKSKVTISGSATVGQSGTPANVYGGGLGENTKVNGNVEVAVNSAYVNIYGDVYGGSAKGLVNCTDQNAQNASTKTEVTLTNGTIAGNIYGGGHGLNSKDAHVWGPVTVTVNNGSVANVFGGNNLNGAPQKAVKVEIKGGTVTNNIYGGGDKAAYAGTPEVIVDGGSVTHKVIGGGNEAGVGGGNVKIKSGSVGTDQTADNGVYGGCNQSGTVSGAIAVEVNGGTIGTSDALDNLKVTNVFGGGYGSSTNTSGNVVVNINNGTIYGDVYGGSALGSVNTQNGTNTTTVNIMGGTLETHITTTPTAQAGINANVYNGGNVYGGGLGNTQHAAAVNGAVTVNIGTGTLAANPNPDTIAVTGLSGSAVIKGNVYGCNNAKGSPQQNVMVNVFKTGHPTDYVLPNVFGGGNQADFTVNGKTAKVNVYTCDNVIGRVFGGGNAAATNSVRTMIQGGTISEVYGGGNGEVTAADVNGTATLVIHGGDIGQNYGGSNQQGTILNGSTVTVDDLGPCATMIDEFFCGGNYADYPGNINATIDCNTSLHVRNLYGGCNMANVVPKGTPGSSEYEPGNIHLKVYGGTFENVYGGSKGDLASLGTGHTDKSANIAGDVRLDLLGGTIDTVFGGCNINGNIAGMIIVNVIDTVGDCPLVVHNVYGGGRDASYTPSTTAALAGQYPEVNVIHGSITKSTATSTDGNVFGGGYGATAAINSTPKVRIGYDASMSGYLPTNYVITENNRQAVVEGNVYGGGDLAPVSQGTVVTIQKTNSSVEGNVFGGGNLANVLHSTTVNVNGGTVTEDVYGGGALADVGTTSSDNTTVTVAGGTVNGSVYGGGLGDATHPAEVNGAVQVTVNSGTVNNVFGCNNEKGAPTSTVRVDINNNVGGNVYGGGNLAACGISPAVYINKGTVAGNVFGGGLGSTAVVAGTPTVTVGNLTNGETAVATVSGDVYGGGDEANVEGTTMVLVQKCNTVVNGDVYGGGNAAHVNKNGSTGGTTSVTVTGGTITGTDHGMVFGGGHGNKDQNISANVETSTSVIINGGTINRVFGGSNSMGTINGGNAGGINVSVSKTDNACPMHITEVYGGGNEANSQAGSITVGCTGTFTSFDSYEGIENLYGGARKANITMGDILLNVEKGVVKNVFGGNNISGTISGTITVNIDQKDACLHVYDVYGGGNQAYYGGTPQVNMKAGTVSHNVYGGGNNITEDGKGVNGSDVRMSGGIVEGDVYGGCNEKGTVLTTSSVKLTNGRVKGSVYGGGLGVNTIVTGRATVEITGTETKVDTDVYGGGNNGLVNGGTEVKIY